MILPKQQCTDCDFDFTKHSLAWHFECSATAKEVLGGRIEIHAGEKDARFLLHSHEIAQAEVPWL